MGKNAIHLVCAWASANRLVLAQVKGDEKSKEIQALPHLLEVLDLAYAQTVQFRGSGHDFHQTVST